MKTQRNPLLSGASLALSVLHLCVMAVAGSSGVSASSAGLDGPPAPDNQNKMVKLVINVESAADPVVGAQGGDPLVGAKVSIPCPDPAQTASCQNTTNNDGVATLQVETTRTFFGTAQLDLTVKASMGGYEDGQVHISYSGKIPDEVTRTIKLRKMTMVGLKVQVLDPQGKGISGVHVNVYQQHISGSWWRASPSDYHGDTSPDGVVRFPVVYKPNENLKISVEVSREDLQTQRRDDINFGKPGTGFSTTSELELDKPFILAPKAGGEGIVSVKFNVQDDAGRPVWRARVHLTDVNEKREYEKFTEGDGSVIIAVTIPHLGILAEHFKVAASKDGYKPFVTTFLYEKEMGTTVDYGSPLIIAKTSSALHDLMVHVMNDKTHNGVADAAIELDYEGSRYSTSTQDNSGMATVSVKESGNFTVKVSQEYYEPYTATVQIADDTQRIPDIFLKPKAKQYRIEVTVLENDTTDPIPGASVSDGRKTELTDPKGHATLTGDYYGSQDITVTADGYKSKTQSVGINKLDVAGTSTKKFILEPDLSENSPVRLVIQVLDPGGNKVPEPPVILRSAGRALLVRPDEKGAAFDSRRDAVGLTVSELRRTGLTIDVAIDGYKPILNRSVPANLLNPSPIVGQYSVPLERDWSVLEGQIKALEGRAAAWQANARSLYAENPYKPIASELVKQARQVGDEINAARDQFGLGLGSPFLADPQHSVQSLQEDIQNSADLADASAATLQYILDQASATAAKCSTQADADLIRSNCREAINILAEIGQLHKAAVGDRDDLLQWAGKANALKRLIREEMEPRLAKIDSLVGAAEQNASSAASYLDILRSRRASLVPTREQLKAETANLKDQVADAPQGLFARLTKVEDTLGYLNDSVADLTPKAVPSEVTQAPTDIRLTWNRAKDLIEEYQKVVPEIDRMDQTVDGINTTLTNASFDMLGVGELWGQADKCAKAAAPTNTDNKGGQGVEPLPEDKKPAAGATNNPADNNSPANNNGPANSASASNNAPAPTAPETTTATPANPSSGASSGLCEPQDVAQRVEALIDDAINVTSFVAADLYLAQARALAAPYPCMTARVNRVEAAITIARDWSIAPEASKTSTGLPNENGPYVDVPNPSHSPTVEGLPEDNPSPIPNNLGPGMRLGAVVTAGGAWAPTVESIPEDLPKGRTSPASNNPPPAVEPTPEDNPQAQPEPVASGDPGPSGASGNAQKKPTDPNAPSPWEKIGEAIGTAAEFSLSLNPGEEARIAPAATEIRIRKEGRTRRAHRRSIFPETGRWPI